MKTTRLFVLAAVAASFFVQSNAYAGWWPKLQKNPASDATLDDSKSQKLSGYVQQSDDVQPSVGAGGDGADVDGAFQNFASMGGHDLTEDITPVMFKTIGREKFDGWSHGADQTPGADVLYPNWNAWLGGMMTAMYQIRWELVTDPHQQVCRLGPRYMLASQGSSLWQSPHSRRKGMVIHNCWYPALSTANHFNGKARVLVEIHPGNRLSAKVVSSTLPTEVTQRLKQSIESLNGHPTLTYPASGTKFDTVAIVYNFGFSQPITQ